MIKLAVPLLHVSNSMAAENFYCHQLGFKKIVANRPDSSIPDRCYLVVNWDGIVLHLSSFPGDGIPGHVVNLLVTDVNALHDEFAAKGLTIDLEPTNQTWGNREMYIREANNNCIRF